MSVEEERRTRILRAAGKGADVVVQSRLNEDGTLAVVGVLTGGRLPTPISTSEHRHDAPMLYELEDRLREVGK